MFVCEEGDNQGMRKSVDEGDGGGKLAIDMMDGEIVVWACSKVMNLLLSHHSDDIK